MGHESILYGAICGAAWKITDYHRLQLLNEAVIAALPPQDEWPFLTRQLFALPGGTPQEGRYRSQLIHFGGTFKAIEWEWGPWLAKFEQLLSRLFWHEVYLHLRTEGTVGSWDYYYEALDARECFFEQEPPLPATKWQFTGGPRHFNEQGLDGETFPQTWIYSAGIWSAG